MTTSEMIIPVLENNNMAQIFLTILFYIFVVTLICCAIVLIVISLASQSLLCAKIYTFIFEHDDWLLYKKAKKHGIQHYLNGYHFSNFWKKWGEEEEKLDEKFNDLSLECHYIEYTKAYNKLESGDIVLSSTVNGGLCIYNIPAPYQKLRMIISRPLIEDVLKNMNNYTADLLIDQPQNVISF